MFSIINLREHPGEIFFVGSTVTGASDSAGAVNWTASTDA